MVDKELVDPTIKMIQNYSRIEASVKRMSSMIDDLLTFSRLGRQELSLQVVNLNELLSEIIEQSKHANEKLNVVWKIDSLPSVNADKGLLKMVFENLISNAIKYSSKNDQIVIEIGAHIQSEYTEIFIRDNGVGFNMKYADNLFGVFQRLHSSDEFEGVGIGLANVKQIITKHHGLVRGESEPGKGAIFTVSFQNVNR